MTSRADSLTHEDLMKAMEEADVVKKELGIGASTESRINKVVANQYQYATPGDSKAFIDEIERLRAELASECERRDEIIASTTKLWKDAEAALAEARDVMMELHNDLRDTIIKEYAGTTQYLSQAIKYDRDMEPCRRAAQWLERNP